MPLTDYRGWAHGLKRCGYATDSLYAEKLISMIETYRLDLLVDEKPVVREEKKHHEQHERRKRADEYHIHTGHYVAVMQEQAGEDSVRDHSIFPPSNAFLYAVPYFEKDVG